MTDVEKLLEKGIVEKLEVPLTSKKDFIFDANIIKHRSPQNHHEKKEYFITLKVKYKGHLLLDNITDFDLFRGTIQLFIQKGNRFTQNNIYFAGKTKNGEASLKVNVDSNRYISEDEAKQMNFIMERVFSGKNTDLLLRRYITDIKFYMSSKYAEKQGLNDMNLKDTEIIDFIKE